MPQSGDTIENRLTGERITFIRIPSDAGGELLELESTWTRRGGRAAEHIHPSMEETIEILSGEARYRIAGTEHAIHAGEAVTIPPGTPHFGWNPTDAPVRLRMTFRPPGRWAEFVEAMFELLNREDRSNRAEDYAALMADHADDIEMVERRH